MLFLPVMTKKKRSNQKNIAILPIAKPYLFDILLKKTRKNPLQLSHEPTRSKTAFFFDILLEKKP